MPGGYLQSPLCIQHETRNCQRETVRRAASISATRIAVSSQNSKRLPAPRLIRRAAPIRIVLWVGIWEQGKQSLLEGSDSLLSVHGSRSGLDNRGTAPAQVFPNTACRSRV